MARLSLLLAAAVALALTAPAFAQDAKTEAEPGSTYIAATHGDWEVQCVRSEFDADPCQLYQLLKDDKDNSVAEISLFGLGAGQPAAAGATVIAPLETLLTEGLAISYDGGEPRRYPFAFCTSVGCIARVGMTQAEIDQMKAGASATMYLVPMVAPDQQIALKISLIGFTAGYDAVDAANIAADAAAAAAAAAGAAATPPTTTP